MAKDFSETTIHLRFPNKSVKRNQERLHLRQMLLQNGPDSLQEHEIANLLLALNNAKIDKNFDSKQVIKKFESLYGLLTADHIELSKFGVEQNSIDVFDVVHEASRRLAGAETKARVLLSDTNALALHLGVGSISVTTNHLVALFLNARNHLLDQISFPSNRSTSDISRKIGKHVLHIRATSLILATMRKGTSALPTSRDTDFTNQMKQMASALAFKFLEHVVLSSEGGRYSFRLSSNLTLPKGWPDQSSHLPLEQTTKLDKPNIRLASASIDFAEDEFSSLFVDPISNILETVKASKRILGGTHKLAVISDLDLLEILLKTVPNRDPVMATRLMRSHTSFANVLNLTVIDLMRTRGLKPATAAAIKVIHTAAIRVVRAAVIDKPRLVGHANLTRYLRASLSRERIEHFRVLFLDESGRLQADELQSRGTVNHIEVYPREIVHRALELGSKTLILVHNHPSGDPSPSSEDIDMTRQVEDAAFMLGLQVGDHIIVGNGSSFSFREEGLLRPIVPALEVIEGNRPDETS